MRPVELSYKILRYSGLPFLFREVLFRNVARIALFHDPGPAEADRVLAYLSKRYSIITLEHLISGRPLPPKALVITLDDGHIGNYQLLPVFRKYGVKPTIFLTAGLVDTNRHFWFLHPSTGRAVPELKELPNAERLKELALAGFDQRREFADPHALQRVHIEAMKDHVDLQSHGLFHPCLPFCSDQEAYQEINHAKEELESKFGLHIKAFAFPNGDHGARELKMVKEAGYACAVTVDYGFNRPGHDPFRLKRLSLDDSGNVDALSVKISGVWTILRVLARKQRLSRFSQLSRTLSATLADLFETPLSLWS